MPVSVAGKIRPYWHKLTLYIRYFRNGGRLKYDFDLLTFVASKKMPASGNGERIYTCVRSGREFRRWIHYGESDGDLVYEWLGKLSNNNRLWDVGSANGLEGFQANLLTDCPVVFIEPFTPSIESILKTRYLNEKYKGRKLDMEIVHAACSDKPGFGRLVSHSKPVAGVTASSLEDNLDDYCGGGRENMNKSVDQWIKYISLDELLDAGLGQPTHIKIDVDGFERKVLEGANKVFSSDQLLSAAIEINDDNRNFVDNFMTQNGFACDDIFVHYDTDEAYTADHIYYRSSEQE